VLDGGDRRRRRVVEMDPRPDAAAAADDRQLSLARERDERFRRVRPVERPVPKDDSLERRLEHGPLEVADRLQRLRLRLRGLRLERIVLRLKPGARAAIRPARVALCDEPLDSDGARGGEEVPGALRPQRVGTREPAVEVFQVRLAGESGHLVDDRLRLGPGDGVADGCRVEPVDRDRLGAQRPQLLHLLPASRRGRDPMAAHDQLGHEAGADRSRRTCNEDSHRSVPPDSMGSSRR
jgi:hypothetical protein